MSRWGSKGLDGFQGLGMGFSGSGQDLLSLDEFPVGVEGFQSVWKVVSGCGWVSVFVDLLHPNHSKTNKTTQNTNFVIFKYTTKIYKFHKVYYMMKKNNANFKCKFHNTI